MQNSIYLNGTYIITPVNSQTMQPINDNNSNNETENFTLSGQTRKISIELTEENYWYLKDVAYANRMQMKEYLNMLLDADRNTKK